MDINAEYKRRFGALTEQLGRVRDTRDREFWVLTDWYRHNVNSFTSGVGRGGDVPSRSGVQTARTREDQAGQSLTEPPRLTADGSKAGSQPERASVDPGVSQTAMAAGELGTSTQTITALLREADEELAEEGARLFPVGGRGPNGGIVAVCKECTRTWERPVSRGRPARRCEECRDG